MANIVPVNMLQVNPAEEDQLRNLFANAGPDDARQAFIHYPDGSTYFNGLIAPSQAMALAKFATDHP